MIYIHKDATPDFWNDYVSDNRLVRYRDADLDVKTKLRKHMLKVQGYVCAYCCSRINLQNSEIEHIKPIAKYSNLSMDYSNMVVSCANGDTCDRYKSNKYDEKQFVSPLFPDCACHFSFLQDGRIKGTDEQGEYTIETLNLNSYELRRHRCNLFKMLRSCPKEYVQNLLGEQEDGKLPEFIDMIRSLFG